MAKKQVKIDPASIKYTKDEIIRLWTAYLRGDKDAPKSATAKHPGEWMYAGDRLFEMERGEWKVVAQGYTRKTKNDDGKYTTRRYIIIAYKMFTRSGWQNYMLHDKIESSMHRDNGMALHAPGTSVKPTVNELNYMFLNASRDELRNTALMIGKLLGYKRSEIIKPREIPEPEYKFTGPQWYQDTAAKVIGWYSPEAVAARKAKKIEEQFRQRIERNHRSVMFPFEREYVSALENVRSGTLSNTAMMEHYGYKPQPGDLFKRLDKSNDTWPDGTDKYYANSGEWPKIGEWTDKIVDIEPCRRGWHLCDLQHLDNWESWGRHVFLVEVEGPTVKHQDDKIVAHRAKLVKYIGDFSFSAKQDAYRASNAAQVAENERKRDQALLERNMARAGYDHLIPNNWQYEEEHKYMRRLIDQSIPLNK